MDGWACVEIPPEQLLRNLSELLTDCCGSDLAGRWVVAVRGDCAKVRSLASRVAARDPKTYQTKLVKQANVARCLAPTQ